MALDINAFNHFVNLAQNAQIDDNSRITLQRNAEGQIAGLRTTETSGFSRLMERTFRGADAKAAYTDVRSEVVDVLKNLFGVKDVDHLPRAVRNAFVDGEVVCDRPLTQRRLKAVLTAASQTLGYGSLSGLKKFVTMNVDIQKKLGVLPNDNGDSVEQGQPVVNPVRENPVDGEDLDDSFESDEDGRLYEDEDDFNEKIDTLASDEGGKGVYTADELKTYAKEIYGEKDYLGRQVGYFFDKEVATRVNNEIEEIKNTPETPQLTKIYGSHTEAERVMANVKAIRKFLDNQNSLGAQDNLLMDMRLALDQALDILNDRSVMLAQGKPKITKEKAASFLRGLQAPVLGDQESVVAMIKSFGNSIIDIKSRYSKMTDDASTRVKTYMDNLIGKATGDDKANLKADKARMLEILPKLNPLGKDLLNIANGKEGFLDTLKYLVFAERTTHVKVHDSRLGNRALDEINNNWALGTSNAMPLTAEQLIGEIDDGGTSFDLNN